jgi:2-dehydropantoate 2-reductase
LDLRIEQKLVAEGAFFLKEAVMKIAIMGAGAVGAYYGALLARAGQDVTFIARGKHLAAMRENGLKVNSFFGDFHLSPVQATDNPASVGPVDLILFTVKTYDAISAARAMLPMIGEETAVITMQNMNMAEQVGEIIGFEHILGSVTYVFTAVSEPGVISQTSDFHRIIFGEFSNEVTSRAEAIRDVLESSGATIRLSDDIQEALWSKLLVISPLGGVSSVVRVPAGQYRDVPESRLMLIKAMTELESLARAQGVNLDADIVEQKMRFVDGLEPGAITSMQRDVLAGRPSEMEELIGMVCRMAEETGVSAPTYQFIYAALKPAEVKARN